MNSLVRTKTPARHEPNPEGGYTLVEFVIVAALICTLAAIAVFQLRPTWQDQQASAGMDQVKSALREARETAVAQRRTIIVKFVATAASTACLPGAGILDCIELFQMVVSGSPPTATQATNPYLALPIEGNVQFATFAGETDVPSPDNFVSSGSGISVPTGIYFGNPVVANGPSSGMEFQSDGTFTDGNGNAINGTVFLAVLNIANSARAVTILGNTGRIRAWKYTGRGWFQ